MAVSDQSVWFEEVNGTQFGALSGEVSGEAVIIGGGITGVTAAYLLARAGVPAFILCQS